MSIFVNVGNTAESEEQGKSDGNTFSAPRINLMFKDEARLKNKNWSVHEKSLVPLRCLALNLFFVGCVCNSIRWNT